MIILNLCLYSDFGLVGGNIRVREGKVRVEVVCLMIELILVGGRMVVIFLFFMDV